MRPSNDAYLFTITQQVGFALWQLQELKGSPATVLGLLAQASQGMGRIAGDALVEKEQLKTFGATIKQTEKANLLSSWCGTMTLRAVGRT